MQSTFEDIGTYLSSDISPKECMMLSDLDGFLTGIACTPVPVEEWACVALGNAHSVPARIMTLVEEHLHSIRKRLSAEPGTLEPVFWQAPEGHVIAMDWCEGFMEAVKLRPDVWERLSNTEIGAKLMIPIMAHVFDEQGNSTLGFHEEGLDETLDTAAAAIPQVVPAIYERHRLLAVV